MFALRTKLAAAVAGLALLAGAAPAGATGAPYHLDYTKLGDGRTVVQRWNPCQVITYKVNLAAVPAASRKAYLAESQQAVARVAAATGLTFGYRGTTTEVPTQGSDKLRQSAEVIIAWTTPGATTYPLAGSTAGYGGHIFMSWWTGTTDSAVQHWSGATVRGYLVLDTPQLMHTIRFGFGPGATQGNVIQHELGHVVGLDHTTASNELMYPMINAHTPNGYGPGDRAGLALIGRRAGCLTVPSWVATDLK